ncbi:F-box protein [Sesamum alatum]|uniref:F-box protein n=1 Tax=Sesamum alatum TaxID=300844 RepID=A0AAE1XM66_9LAMI|nr:F-box protein [Sesamum alatum]
MGIDGCTCKRTRKAKHHEKEKQNENRMKGNNKKMVRREMEERRQRKETTKPLKPVQGKESIDESRVICFIHTRRFSKVIELKSVWWLDVKGKIKVHTLTPKTTYATYLVFKLAKRYEGLEIANATIRFVSNESSDDDARNQTRVVHLQPQRRPGSRQTAVRRDDGWMEVEMGSFYVHEGEEREVEAQLLETRRWQTGLIIEGIEFRPVACLSN